MSPNYVTLVLNEYDAAGNPIVQGTATLTPNSSLVDVTDQMDITPYVPPVTFRPGPIPQVKLLATDNANVSPSGWAWTLTFSGVPGNPPARSFFLPFSGGATQYLSSLTTSPSPPAAPSFTARGSAASTPARRGDETR